MPLIIIITCLLCIVMELNKNTLLGWLLVAACLALYIAARRKAFPGQKHRKLWINLIYAGTLAAAFFLSWPPVRAVPASDAKNPKVTEVIHVNEGDLTGVYSADEEVEIFAGIPYAAPPVGDLRWKEPQEPDSWDGVRACDTFAPMSMQPANGNIYDSLAEIIGYHDYAISLKDNYTPPMSEDSLYLNIWRPADAEAGQDLPVLVYIHGGSLKTGQPWYGDYAGMGLAKNDVIVVNMAYRLGVFGFYGNSGLQAESSNGTTGNYGLLDQMAALQWVQNNISAFGGDPENVTVAGESAGSACVSALCSSPLAKGLFHRAILESSTVDAEIPAHSYRSFDETLSAGEDLYKETGESSLEGLRSLSAKALVKFTEDNHHITPDGYVLADSPYNMAKSGAALNAEEILNGYNGDESAAFVLFDKFTKKNFAEKLEGYCSSLVDDTDALASMYEIKLDEEAESAMREILSASWFGYGHQCLTEKALDQGIPVYEYYFNQENGRLGNWHSGEEVYCYGNIPSKSHWYDAFMGPARLYSEEDRELGSIMLTYWRNFAATGDPNDSGTEAVSGKSAGGSGAKNEKSGNAEFAGKEQVIDRYGLWEEGFAPALPAWNPVTDPDVITEFRVGGGTYVREIEVPYLQLYDVLKDHARQ